MALSQSIFKAKIEFLAHPPFLKPKWYSRIYGKSSCLTLILSRTLSRWLIRLTVQWLLQSRVPGTFGIVMKMDFSMCSGNSPVSYTLPTINQTRSTPSSPRATIISTGVSSGPTDFLVLHVLQGQTSLIF